MEETMPNMTHINCAKGSDRYNFIVGVLGNPHMSVFKDGKEISVWVISNEDKVVLDEMEKESVK
jgi:hypothetical protein